MNKIKFRKSKTSGFSLIEVIVSTTIFVVILLSMTGIFKMVIDAQRQAIASQNVEESLRYFFEVISKEIRMAKRSGGHCSNIPAGDIFATSTNSLGDILYLRNYHDDCIAYSLISTGDSVVFNVENLSQNYSGILTPSRVSVSELDFFVHEVAGEQAYVSISLSANYLGKEAARSEMKVQTSISSRHYRNPNP